MPELVGFRDARMPERFWAKVAPDSETGCWVWTAGKSTGGYGRYNHEGRQRNAHRVAYEVLVRCPDDGLQLDHLCRNTLCVNPAHLEPVTPWENTYRSHNPAAVNIRKTHCHKGHEFTPENTYTLFQQGGPSRFCRTCRKANAHALYLRTRGKGRG